MVRRRLDIVARGEHLANTNTAIEVAAAPTSSPDGTRDAITVGLDQAVAIPSKGSVFDELPADLAEGLSFAVFPSTTGQLSPHESGSHFDVSHDEIHDEGSGDGPCISL